MKIYDALHKDHNEVRAMLTELTSLGENDGGRANLLIAKIRDALIPHSRAEESVFYNTLRETEAAKDLVMHGYQEHIEAETVLRTLQAAGKIDAGWKTMATNLKKALEHHISEEEGAIFSAAKQTFTDEEAEMMGEAFAKLKPGIQKEGFVQTTLELVANLMPPRFAPAFKKFNLESRISPK